jgi:hypothetical protein
MPQEAMAQLQLRILPRGEMLKPALLGYHQLGADLLWLQAIQVLGERVVQEEDYEWLFHALDVITTLDPQFLYAYDAGGLMLAELAGHAEWSNQLLAKGIAANPRAWRLPFQLGFNYFYYQQDYRKAAEYLAKASTLPGRPSYVPELAARLYVQDSSTDIALRFLDTMRQQTTDSDLLLVLNIRRGEVLIERDIMAIELAVAQYQRQHAQLPASLEELVEGGLLQMIPVEPFGGRYEFDRRTGQIMSSSHPRRLRLHRPGDAQQIALGVNSHE